MIDFIKLTKGYKKEFFLGPLFKLLEAILELIVPLIIALIINKGIKESLGINYIISMVLVLVLFAIVGLIFSITAQYFSAKAAVNFSKSLRSELFNKIQSLSYSEYDNIGTSKLINVIINDCNQIQSGVNLFLRLFLRSPFIVFGALIMAFVVNKDVALIFLIIIPILLAIIFLIMIITKNKYKEVQKRLDNVVLKTRENLTGVRVIRAFGIFDDESKEFDNALHSLRSKQKTSSVLATVLNPLTYVIINIGIIFVIYVSSLKVNEGIILQGDTVALYNYMTQILVEAIKLANMIISLSKALASLNRVKDIMKLNNSLKIEDDNSIVDNKKAYIEFNNVSFKYQQSSLNALSNISFIVNKHEHIGIIGPTGSGKTTLINLLSHFYDCSQGEIFLNGKNINTYSQEYLINHVSIVPQKAVLFKGTIRSNMLWGNRNATDEDIIKALKISQAWEFVSKKIDTIDSIVEENGRNFSGGERQRLSIARAIIKRSDILILDDSTSALDYLTESRFKKELIKLDYNPTVFIITQRTSSIKHSDKILVLENGIVNGFGTHEELLDNSLVYKEIFESQFGGENYEK